MKLLEMLIKLEDPKLPDTVLFVFGAQSSGKSTFCNYLCGHELEHFFNNELDLPQVRVKDMPPNKYAH